MQKESKKFLRVAADGAETLKALVNELTSEALVYRAITFNQDLGELRNIYISKGSRE